MVASATQPTHWLTRWPVCPAAPSTYVYISGTTPMPTIATGRRLQQSSSGNGFTYILNTTSVTQVEASGTCNAIGGQLAAFKSLAEQVGRGAWAAS
jgi:hypothetical protein